MPRSAKTVLFLVMCSVLACGCTEVGARRDIQEGNKLYYAGKYDEAIKVYNEALAARPELAIGWFNLGLSHLAMYSPGLKTPENEMHAKGTIDALSKYLAIVPNDTQARDYLLSTYIDSGRYEDVLAYFEQKLEQNPQDIEAVTQLASVCTQAQRYDCAIKWHKKKAEMVPGTDTKADSWYSIGVMDWRRLYQHPEVTGVERLKIADEGIGALLEADRIRAHHAATLSYVNLLYRERAHASGASYARAVDTASAMGYMKRATELAKKQ
jgi:tetratricopeptide (TPR) repeat protein